MSDLGSTESKGWKTDKHIPIALLLAMAAQLVGIGVFWGMTQQRIANIENWISQNQATDHRLTQVETKIDSVQRSIDVIGTRLGATRPDQR